MAFVLKDRVRESSITTGTGPIALAGAPGGYQRFNAVMAIGDTCWYSFVLPGSAWETGIGTYSALNTLTRTTILESSNAGSAVAFAAGTKDVFIAQPASMAGFQSGTVLPFYNATAPLGWTKSTVNNDKALRVVSGSGGVSGGTNAFSTVMAQTVVGNTTITQTTMASHTHTVPRDSGDAASAGLVAGSGGFDYVQGTATSSIIGGDGPHNHTIALSIQYVDLILCQKN
jgi:hypothetical protein